MTFKITYCQESKRVISGIVLENRAYIPETKGKSGQIASFFIDQKAFQILGGELPYIVEADNGSLAAFFSVNYLGGAAFKGFSIIRRNFANFEPDITEKISNFILSNEWRKDYLQGDPIS